ncbi:MAG: nucleotidyltransferase domain-containing protein [Lachnospiraceae bacterium]|nr:nucleotidyltransferase domain-containing protein [Lachnospiraceae bacterium]
MVDIDNKVFTLSELKMLLLPVFQGYNIKRAVLFGSYSKGQATPQSDVDILVDSGLKGLKFVGLIDDIKNSLQGKEVDVFDVTHVEHGSLVEKEISDTGVEIYAK